MVRWMRDLLYESTPAEFRSTHGVAESVQRLSAATSRSVFTLAAFSETRAVGNVSPDRVRLYRFIPMVGNSFIPVFVGRFESRDGGTVLTGQFGMRASTRVFMTLWLGATAAFAVSFLVADFTSRTSTPVWQWLSPLFMLVAGVGFVSLGKWFARNDITWLSRVIAQALGGPATAVQVESAPDPTAVPLSLKCVALFLAVTGVTNGLADSGGPRVLPLHWQALYGISGLVLAAGVWRRRPWAWWGGFLALGLAALTSVVAMPEMAHSPPPLMIRAVFGVLLLVVGGAWCAWWYGQRRHFLWNDIPSAEK